MLFKLSNLNSNLALTLGYLNPALNNSAQRRGEGGGSSHMEVVEMLGVSFREVNCKLRNHFRV